MTDILLSVFTSAPFRFVVDGETFYAHAELLSRHSDPLGALIRSPMKEGQQGLVELDNVSASTFARFLEWIYQGFYTAPELVSTLVDPSKASLREDALNPKSRSESSEADVAVPPVDGNTRQYDSWYPWPELKDKRASNKAKKTASDPAESKNSRKKIQTDFKSRKHEDFRTAIPIPPMNRNEDENESYSEVFLCHTQMYVYAEMKLIPKLKLLALENLREALKHFTLNESHTSDIILLLRYVYEKTKERPSHTGEREPMRALLMEYLAFEMDILIDDEQFAELLLEHEDLLKDFLNAVTQRI